MYIDASAIVAILNDEDDRALLLHRIETATDPLCLSPVTFIETVLSYAKASLDDKNNPVTPELLDAAHADVTAFIEATEITVLPITESMGELAYQYLLKYGKGRHPAKLNMGDCLAAACAKSYDVPLLYKGDDFAKTDLA